MLSFCRDNRILDETNLETPFGHVSFRSYAVFEGQNSAPTVVLQIANSEFEPVWAENIAAAGLQEPESKLAVSNH